MKNIITLSALLFIGTYAFAQFFNSSHVPQIIKENFKEHFPHTRKLVWKKEEGGYRAAFDLHHKRMYVLYEQDGTEVGQAMEIHKAKLPHNIRKTLRKNYNTFQLVGAAKIQSGKEKGFEMEVVKGKEAYDLVFNENGWLVSIDPILASTALSKI
jgi:hypothetical protein